MKLSLLKQRLPLLIFLVIYFIFAGLSYKDFGITNDEPEEYLLGKFLYTKLRGNDPLLEKNFVINDGKSNNLLFYDRVYLAVLYTFNSQESYQTYHLLNLLFGSFIFIAAYELVLHETHKPWLALIAPSFLVLTPRFFGDIPANPKDVPFAISYFIAICLIYLFRDKKPQPITLLLLGISFGLTQSLRIIGYSIYLVYAIFLSLNSKTKTSLTEIINSCSKVLIIFCIGLLIHFITLPYIAADPLHNFGELLSVAKNFPWQANILFGGQDLSVTNLPWYYLPTWICLTTPIFILGLSLTSLKYLFKHKLIQLFWLAITINLTIFFILKPTIYDGLRHMLFLIPFLSLLASLSLIKLLTSNSKFKKIVIVGVSLNIILVGLNYLQLYPYSYVYFNELIGGLKGANHKFELDYWGASYQAAVEKTNQLVNLSTPHQVYFCGDPQQLKQSAKFSYVLTSDLTKSDVLICHHRSGNDSKISAFVGEPFYISRFNVPLATIKINPQSLIPRQR